MNFQTENAGNTKKKKSNNNRRRCPIKWDGKCDWQGWSDGVSKHIYEAHEVNFQQASLPDHPFVHCFEKTS
jgi:hypothetical protein